MKTKVIQSGNSQAVRIPAAMRLKSREVEIIQEGGRMVIFDPKEREKEMKRRRAALDKLWSEAKADAAKGIVVEFERP